MSRLKKEEKALEESLGQEKWKSASKREIDRDVKAAKSFMGGRGKSGRINIRISEEDLALVKEGAAKEGLAYQSHISRILHKYITGQLVDREVINELQETIKNLKTIKV